MLAMLPLLPPPPRINPSGNDATTRRHNGAITSSSSWNMTVREGAWGCKGVYEMAYEGWLERCVNLLRACISVWMCPHSVTYACWIVFISWCIDGVDNYLMLVLVWSTRVSDCIRVPVGWAAIWWTIERTWSPMELRPKGKRLVWRESWA